MSQGVGNCYVDCVCQKKGKVLYSVPGREILYGAATSTAGNLYIAQGKFCIVHACVGIKKRLRISDHILLYGYSLFNHRQEKEYDAALFHGPLRVLAYCFAKRLCEHTLRVTAGHRDSAA